MFPLAELSTWLLHQADLSDAQASNETLQDEWTAVKQQLQQARAEVVAVQRELAAANTAAKEQAKELRDANTALHVRERLQQ